MIKAEENKDLLTKWWIQLNHLEWPDGFPYLKPIWWDEADRATRGEMVGSIQPAILAILGGSDFMTGYKVVLRAQNEGLTSDEFETYWLKVIK